MKNVYLLLAFSPLAVHASNFNVVVPKETSKYKTTEFISTGKIICDSYDITEADVYKNEIKQQTGSFCKQEFFDGKNYVYTPIKDQVKNITGTHLENNCKNILNFDNSLSSKDYLINLNGNETSVSCDMDTDGGGWTLLSSHSYSGSVTAPSFTINDKNLDYSEILYFDIDSKSSYGGGDPVWGWRGFEAGRQILRFDSDWYYQSGAFPHPTCNLTPNSLPVSNYRSIDNNVNLCKYSNTDINTCYNIVAIKVPNGKRITGFGDVESLYNTCNGDNTFNMNFKILVR